MALRCRGDRKQGSAQETKNGTKNGAPSGASDMSHATSPVSNPRGYIHTAAMKMMPDYAGVAARAAAWRLTG